MDVKQRLEVTKNQLSLVLSFFPRVDSQASVMLAIDTAMLATLTSNAPNFKSFEYCMMFAVIPAVLFISLSIYNLYRLAYPRLPKLKESSVIYFKEVGEKAEDEYQKIFLALGEEDYVKDLIGQIWQNSRILKEKYEHLRLAFLFLAISLLPWMISLSMFSSKNLELKTLLAK
jgi:hypothetical protein